MIDEVDYDINVCFLCMFSQVQAVGGYERHSGERTYHVRVDKLNSKGHMFIGFATAQSKKRSFVGNDRISFGILLTGDVYNGGSTVAGRKWAVPRPVQVRRESQRGGSNIVNRLFRGVNRLFGAFIGVFEHHVYSM